MLVNSIIALLHIFVRTLLCALGYLRPTNVSSGAAGTIAARRFDVFAPSGRFLSAMNRDFDGIYGHPVGRGESLFCLSNC